jgi:hypothetical protein
LRPLLGDALQPLGVASRLLLGGALQLFGFASRSLLRCPLWQPRDVLGGGLRPRFRLLRVNHVALD